MDYDLLEDQIHYFNKNKKNGDKIAEILLDAIYKISELRDYDILIASDLRVASIAISIADAEGATCSLIHTAEEFEHLAQTLRKRAERINLPRGANDTLPPFLQF